MNWLWLITLGIIIFFALKGRRDGFIKTIFAISSLLVAILVTSVVSPYVSKAIQSNASINAYIVNLVGKTLHLEETKDKEAVSEETEAIDELKLPVAIKKALTENNNSEVYKALAVNSFKEYIANYLACIIINAISFIVTFAVLRIILFAIASALDIVSRLPIINGLNKTAGLLIGIFRGLIAIWILCIVLTVFGGTVWGQSLYAMINESRFLSSLYNNNLLLQVITNLAKVLF